MAFFKFIVALFKKAIWVTASAIVIATGYYSMYPMEVPACWPPVVEITDSVTARKRALSVFKEEFKRTSPYRLKISYEVLLAEASIKTSRSQWTDGIFQWDGWVTYIGYGNSNGDLDSEIYITLCGELVAIQDYFLG